MGSPYNAVISVRGGTAPYQFSIVSATLPSGLSLNSTTGTISGTPLASGTYSFAVIATDAAGTSSRETGFTLAVAEAAIRASITISPANARVYSGDIQQFTAKVINTDKPGVTWTASAGSISNTGVFTAPVVTVQSTVRVTAIMVADPTKTASASVTVNSNPSGFDGPAELPRVYLQSTMTDTPTPGNVINVNAADSLQTALNNASCGDTILLQAGATFTGSFTLPAKRCDDQHWIVVRTSAPDSSLPPEGTRMTPCYAGVASLPGRPAFQCSTTQKLLPQIAYKGIAGNGPLTFAWGANHYRLLGLEITRLAGTGFIGDLVSVKSGGTADRIVIDRVWLHGTAHDETGRGVGLNNTTNVSVVDSYLNDFHCTSVTGSCVDSQAVQGGGGIDPGGPYKIVNNFLEAAAESVLFGGGPAAGTPADIEIRGNHFFKPLQWMPGAPGFVGGTDGRPFIAKNNFELKNAQRVLFEGNILEYSWGGFSQAGYSILLTPKNQTWGTTNVCPICQVTDVTIRYSIISHAGAGITIANVLSAAGGMAVDGARYSIHDITLDDITAKRYNGSGPLILVLNNWTANPLNSVTINHITGINDPSRPMLTLGNQLSNPAMWGFNFTNNIVIAGSLPVWSAGGGSTACGYHDVPITSLNACFSTYTFADNALVANPLAYPPSKWPSGNYFPVDVNAVQFVNYKNGNGGDYHLQTSSPYKNAGSDGKDLGADIAAIEAATAGVY